MWKFIDEFCIYKFKIPRTRQSPFYYLAPTFIVAPQTAYASIKHCCNHKQVTSLWLFWFGG